MRKVQLMALVILLSPLSHAEESKVENAWAEAVTAPAPAEVAKPAKRKKPKVDAKTDSAISNERSPASPPNANKVIPSALQLPIAVATLPPSAAVPIPGKLTLSGFANFRYTAFSAPNDPNVPNPHAESGFGIEDGAFNAVYDIEKFSFTADLAIRRYKDFDQTSSASIPNQSSTDRLNIGADPSEFYIKYKPDDHWAFDLGQYFGIFGAESAQSRSRTFTKTSMLFGVLPSVQTGFMTEYSNNGWNAKVEATNPNNKGTYGSSAQGDENTEYTGAFGYSNEVFQSQVGYMTRPIGSADGSSRGDRTLMDVTLGLTLGAFTLSGEATRIDDPSKNTITPNLSSDHERAGLAYLAIGTYKLNDRDLLGLRYEKLNDDPGNAGLNTADAYGVAAHHRLHQNVDVSAEFNTYNYQSVSGSVWRDNLFSIGAIVSF